MDSYSARANTIFCSFVTVLGTFAVMNHLTSYLPEFTPKPTAKVAVRKVHDMTVNTYLNMDQSTLSFDLDHDFTTEFHWNMNQLFVYLVASYNDTSNKKNEVTLWDRVVSNQEEALLSAKQLMVEYPLRDQFRELRGRDVRLHLRYRSMPITGVMYTKEICTTDFTTAKDYFRDSKKK